MVRKTAAQREQIKGLRKQRRDAREELERVSRRDRCESDDYLAANHRIYELDDQLREAGARWV